MKAPTKLLLVTATFSVAGLVIFQSGIFRREAVVPASSAAVPLAEIAPRPLSAEQEDYLRPELREALGMVAGVPKKKRLDLLQAMDGELSADEGQAMLQALLAPRPAKVAEGWNSEYMHEICLVLGRQVAVRAEFARALATLARDATRDEVVRDYSLQHLRQLWERSDATLQESIVATFREVADDPALAPAALLSLHVLGSALNWSAEPHIPAAGPSRRTFRIPDSDLEPLLAGILKDAPTAGNVVARMTAVRVVRERSLSTLDPAVRRIAGDRENEHAVVRMAAIATLAASGDPADRAFLESIDREDPRIDSAVRHALASRR